MRRKIGKCIPRIRRYRAREKEEEGEKTCIVIFAVRTWSMYCEMYFALLDCIMREKADAWRRHKAISRPRIKRNNSSVCSFQIIFISFYSFVSVSELTSVQYVDRHCLFLILGILLDSSWNLNDQASSVRFLFQHRFDGKIETDQSFPNDRQEHESRL